jgi:soluble lytic murein transglycosylase-like protein
MTAAPAGANSLDRWTPYVAEASARFGIPAGWIQRVMSLESGGRTLRDGRPVISRAGAMGLMQLMPRTWLETRALLGLGSDPFEPRDNILAGTFYLRTMYERFGYPGLFAAYNAGPGRYAAYLAGARPLPAETRSYLAAAAAQSRAIPAWSRPQAPIFVLAAGAASDAKSDRASSAGLFVALGGSLP